MLEKKYRMIFISFTLILILPSIAYCDIGPKPYIEVIVKKTHKVIFIGHSLGGLLGRAYMIYFNPASIDKLIMIGTPNLGTVNAYYFWSGGKLPYSKVEDDILYNGLKMAFILYFKMFKDINHMEALRNMFPIVKDLLPSYNYRNYLFYEENENKIEIPIENMSVKKILFFK